ncbi:MAG: Gfo/Idh/MocA family oxidoreductase [Chloroflexota bacterium]|nr:Gfo/Idh/MocA family oxidoreductase [Chloroflexota bacterium]
MNEIKFGVVGAGYWGPHLIRNVSELPGARLSAIADLSASRLQALRPRFPTAFMTQDYQQILESDVEAVVIATPVKTHHQIAMDALDAGKHVLVEKPLTRTSQEALELIATAEQNGLTLMVGHTFEYNPAVIALRDIVQGGQIGRVLYVDGARLNLGVFRSDVNVMWDLAPHDISIMNFVLESVPVNVSARGNTCLLPDKYDVAYLDITYENGVSAHLHLSWLDPCKVRRFTVVGDEKMVVYDDMTPEEKIRLYERGVTKPSVTGDYAEYQYRNGGVWSPPIAGGEPLKFELMHFSDCIREGRRPQSDGWCGLGVIEVLEAADQSLKNGGMRTRIERSSLATAVPRYGTDFASRVEIAEQRVVGA